MKNKILKMLEAGVLNFLHRVEHKLPEVLADLGREALKYTSAAMDVFSGKKAGQIEALVPETEPFRAEIIAVLKELELVFKAITKAGAPAEPGANVVTIDQEGWKKGLLFAAASKIASIKHEKQLPMNRYNIAVQVEYSSHPESAANLS